MATTLNLIQGALRRIVSYQSGEAIAAPDSSDCLDTFNDMLDSWSIDKQLVFGSVETVLQLNNNQNQYKIGNPTCSSIGEPPFTGTVTSGSKNITGVTIPADLVSGTAASGSGAGSTITSLQGLFPTGTYVTAASGTTVTVNNNATANSVGLDTLTYTIPGDWAIPRPNRITHGFTRYSLLDFTCEVTMSQSRFLEILYKGQPGPWPTVAWYNPQMPYGLFNVYQTPSNNASFHLFTDTILANLTLNQTFVLPAGYARALKWCLAKEICAEYGFPLTEAIKTNAAESYAAIKALNAEPAAKAKYDSMLLKNRANAAWILTGGYQ